VWLDLRSTDEVEECSAAVFGRGTELHVMVAEYINGDLEIFLGMVRDAVFGPVVLLGMGGRWFGATNGVVAGLLPMESEDAGRLIADSTVDSAISTLRYSKACRSRLIEIICRISDLSAKQRQVVSIDVNPLLATHDRLVAVDALIVTAETSRILVPRNTRRTGSAGQKTDAQDS
jgi:hypothetical protein